MPGGVLENETVSIPVAFAGTIANEIASVFGVPGGGVLANNPQAVLGRVLWFEEVTDREQNRNIDGNRRMTRAFQLMTSHPLVGSTTVALFDQLVTPFEPPDPGAAFNGNPQRRVPRPGDKYVELDDRWNVIYTANHVVCVGVRVYQTDADNLRNWMAVAEYVGEDDPLAQPHEVDWETVPYQEALLVEVDEDPPFAAARPVLNSAKDPFREGVLTDGDRDQVTIVKNVINYDPVAAKQYQNSINANTYLAARHPPGYPPGTCKVKLKARRVRRSSNTDFYWRVTAVVEIDLRGWDARVRDAGFNYLPGGVAAQKTPIALHPRFVGRPAPSTEQLLKPDGDLADPADPVPDPLTFRKHKRKSWTALGFVLEY